MGIKYCVKKEYDLENNLIFEGEYLNGIKNGKGKEFYKNLLLFDGEYLNGYRISGKLFIHGKLEFEGKFLFDKKYDGKGYDENGNKIYEINNGNGYIKLYNYFNGYLEYEGEYLNMKKNGRGKEYNNNNVIFEGEFSNNKRHGQGKEYENNKLIFEGEY